MRLFSMRAQALPMIGCDYDQRIVVQLAGTECRDQLACCCIGGSHRGIVGGVGRGLRIIEMYPEEKWAFGVTG